MPSVEERVAILEGRIVEQAGHFADLRAICAGLRDSIGELRAEMQRRFEQVDRRFDAMQTYMDLRFDRVERHMTWLVGIMIGGFVTMLGAMVGISYG